MKTVLCSFAPKPLTIERTGCMVTLQLHQNTLRLGVESTKWFTKALREAMYGAMSDRQELRHDGRTVLTVFNDSGRIFVIGNSCRFSMVPGVVTRLIEWLECN